MARYVHDDVLDASFNVIKNNADQQTLCSQQPTTHYEAVDPPAWGASTAYSLGDAVRPTTRNGFVYECTAAGTGGASEPTWPTTAGGTVVDGGITWTCRANYVLASVTMTSGDYTIADGDTSGRKITVGSKTGATIHTSDNGTHAALVDTSGGRLLFVTPMAAQALTAGNPVTFGSWTDTIGDPVAP